MPNVSAQDLRDLHPKFTLREQEILQLICEGYTTDEIASKLYLSNHTITTHRANMMEKTGARNVVNMVFLFLKNTDYKFLHGIITVIISLFISSISCAQINDFRIKDAFEIGGSGIDYVYDAIPTSDDEILMVGRTNSIDFDFSGNPSSTRSFVCKANRDGEVIWTSFYPTFDVTYDDIVELNNGSSIIVVGHANSSVIARSLSDDGNTIGNQIVIDDFIVGGFIRTQVVKESETSFILIGIALTTSPTVLGSRNRLVFQRFNLSSNGIQKSGDTKYLDLFNGATNNFNDLYFDNQEIVAVFTVTQRDGCRVGNSNIGLLRIGYDGSIVSEKIIGGSGTQRGLGVTKATNGDILICGSNRNDNRPNDCDLIDDLNGNSLDEMVLFRLDKYTSDIKWSLSEGGNKSDFGYRVKELSDGQILVSGISWSTDENYDATSIPSDYVIWIYDSNGDYEGQVNLKGDAIDGNSNTTSVTAASEFLTFVEVDNEVWAVGASSSNNKDFENGRISGTGDDIWMFSLGNSPEGRCKWRGWVYNPFTGYLEPDEESCDFIKDGVCSIEPELTSQTTYWTGFSLNDNFNVSADDLSVSFVARNNSSVGGIFCYDIELWIFGENADARAVLVDGGSFCNQFTQFGASSDILNGSSVLNRDLSSWKSYTIRTDGNQVRLSENGVTILSRTYSQNLGELRGVKVAFKGSGQFEEFIIESGNGDNIFLDNFLDCINNCPGCVNDETLTLGVSGGGNFDARLSIQSAMTVLANYNLSLSAGECISLDSGFTIEEDAVFTAQIDECSSECYDPNFVPPPLVFCTAEFLPVCGCNGVTYPNDCVAMMAGVKNRTNGACN